MHYVVCSVTAVAVNVRTNFSNQGTECIRCVVVNIVCVCACVCVKHAVEERERALRSVEDLRIKQEQDDERRNAFRHNKLQQIAEVTNTLDCIYLIDEISVNYSVSEKNITRRKLQFTGNDLTIFDSYVCLH